MRAGAHALTLQLADGKVVSYPSLGPASPAAGRSQLLAHAARVAQAIDVHSLAPGVEVLATLATDRSPGGVTIALPGPGAPEQHASGVVGAVAQDAFVLESSDHATLRLQASPSLLRRLRACQRAVVSYHQDAGVLIADGIRGGRQDRRAAPSGARRARSPRSPRVA